MDMIFNNDDMTQLTLIIGKNIIVHIQNIIWLFSLLFNPSYDPWYDSSYNPSYEFPIRK